MVFCNTVLFVLYIVHDGQAIEFNLFHTTNLPEEVFDLAMDDCNAKTKLHFLMFPLLAQGHINPFLELSKALATHGHKVSFVSTPVNISRIRPFLRLQKWSGQIDLVALALPPTEGLTPGAECMADIPPEMCAALCNAMDGMEKPFESLLGELSPDYLIQDHHYYWTRTIAAEMHIPVIYFAVLSPVFCCYAFHPCKLWNQEITAEELAAPPPGFPSSVITLRPYEARDLLVMYRARTRHVSPISRLGMCLEGCVATIVRSCFEGEDKYIRYLHDAIGLPVFSVGPLMPTVQSGADGSEESELLKWLDRQRAGSVVFVSFGSQVFLSRDQIHELALGLEASGFPFLWSLRFPEYLDGWPHDLLGFLPEGFESRTQDRGLVVQGWVPQVRILSHPAVSWYLSHGGWGSVMESLSFGIPLMFLPLQYDHGLNARLIAGELKAGIEIETGDDGSFLREKISKTLAIAMSGAEGEKWRSNAAKACEIMAANKQSHVHDFIQKLEQLGEDYKKDSM